MADEEDSEEVPMATQTPPGAPVVLVTDGPFKGFEGVVSGINQDEGKVQLLLSFFGRKITVNLDVRQVRRLNAR
jgi:transcriptional antiterminator NusG